MTIKSATSVIITIFASRKKASYNIVMYKKNIYINIRDELREISPRCC